MPSSICSSCAGTGLPFFVINIAPAFFEVKLRTYAMATLVGIVPGTLAYSWLGCGLGDVIALASESGRELALSDFVTTDVSLALVRSCVHCGVASGVQANTVAPQTGVTQSEGRQRGQDTDTRYMCDRRRCRRALRGRRGGRFRVPSFWSSTADGRRLLNYGCVPSKALIAAAKHAEAIRKAANSALPRRDRSSITSD